MNCRIGCFERRLTTRSHVKAELEDLGHDTLPRRVVQANVMPHDMMSYIRTQNMIVTGSCEMHVLCARRKKDLERHLFGRLSFVFLLTFSMRFKIFEGHWCAQRYGEDSVTLVTHSRKALEHTLKDLPDVPHHVTKVLGVLLQALSFLHSSAIISPLSSNALRPALCCPQISSLNDLSMPVHLEIPEDVGDVIVVDVDVRPCD